MVEVSVLFVVLNGPINKLQSVTCSSLYLLESDSKYTILTERVLKCQSFEAKINEMIAKTPFNVKRILYTFGMSAIAIVDYDRPFNWVSTSTIRHNWGLFSIQEVYKYIDGSEMRTIHNFLDIFDKGRYFEHSSNSLIFDNNHS